MTEDPLILTALVDPRDLQPFDDLRRQHFPPERNVLRAHITLFHKLPGEERETVTGVLERVTRDVPPFDASIDGLRHLCAGVCYTIRSADLQRVRARLADAFGSWLGPQDKQGWRPHITVQNKVAKADADILFAKLQQEFQPSTMAILGLELWRYDGGPWEHEATYLFSPSTP
jgi:2'-5' RNA ligase